MSYIYVADIILEAKTAISVGSGANAIDQDRPVQKDWNGMPMLLGTGVAGVLKSLYTDNDKDILFGGQKKESDAYEDMESQLIVSSGLLMYNDSDDNTDKVMETCEIDLPPLFQHYKKLPLREHTAIDHKGVAVAGTKHDNEIVYKGSRFKLRIKLKALEQNDKNKKKFETILSLFYSKGFRVGSKTTAGLGNLKPVKESIDYVCLDETSYAYYNFSSSLNQDASIYTETYTHCTEKSSQIYSDLTFEMIPENFFIFSSGFGTDDGKIDAVQKKEKVVDYETQTLKEMLLIPASSIKGSLSHRTAYKFNCANGCFADSKDFKANEHTGKNNKAVKALFGSESNLSSGQEEGHKGSIIMDDIYLDEYEEKVFDHVSIDDFTGAVIGGALFNERVATTHKPIKINLYVKENTQHIEYLQESIADIQKGWLTLGGMGSRGHGVFKGVAYE